MPIKVPICKNHNEIKLENVEKAANKICCSRDDDEVREDGDESEVYGQLVLQEE